jgi:hypothetical protein
MYVAACTLWITLPWRGWLAGWHVPLSPFKLDIVANGKINKNPISY